MEFLLFSFLICVCVALKWNWHWLVEYIVWCEWLLKDCHHSWRTHMYTHRHTLSEKPLKHLTFHLPSSGAKSLYWLSIFSPRPVQTNGLFVYGLCLCYCVHLLQAGWAVQECLRVCVCARVCVCVWVMHIFVWLCVFMLVHWQWESVFWLSSCANVKQRLNESQQ